VKVISAILKNLVDSECIHTQLRTEGNDITSRYDDAELLIVNTFVFNYSIEKESLDTIGEVLADRVSKPAK